MIVSREHKEDEDEEKLSDSALSELLPFQSLVHQIQREMDPDIDIESGTESDSEHEMERKAIRMKKADLYTMSDYVQQHRSKMKEKTYKYEEKKKQLQNAKERLNKTKLRLKKRLKLSSVSVCIRSAH